MEKYEIKNYKDYKITKDGQVWSDKTNKFMSQHIYNGYIMVKLGRKFITAHREVAKALIPNPDKKPYVNHINSIKTDNRVENLEWVTQKENCAAHGKDISHPKVVIQKTLDGKEVKRFNSLIEASKSIGVSPSAISKAALKINSMSGGFIWDYDQEYTEEVDLSKSKPIYGHKKYNIFPDGTVYNNVRKSIVKPVAKASGYCYVTISSNKTKKNHDIHRIVADHFIKNFDSKRTQVNHINKIRDDNRIENLEWVTPSENMIHAKQK